MKSRDATLASWLNLPIGLYPSSWPPNNPHIYWLASSFCLPSKPVCGGHSGALWLPSHHQGGCCTLVMVEGNPSICKVLWVSGKCYINVINYYYYFYTKKLSVLNPSDQSTSSIHSQLSQGPIAPTHKCWQKGGEDIESYEVILQ